MIQANELRIGNVINKHFEDGEGEQEVVTSRTIFDCQVNPTGKFTYTGIPLTPEILFDCGFSHYKDEHTEFYDKPTRTGLWHGFIFTVANFSDDNYEYKGLIFTHHNIRSECKYLHQLQNLYLCLTGTELNCKIKQIK